MANYNDLIDTDEQVDAEEAIASILFDDFDMNPECAQEASQIILMEVLRRFRPDLVEDN